MTITGWTISIIAILVALAIAVYTARGRRR